LSRSIIDRLHSESHQKDRITRSQNSPTTFATKSVIREHEVSAERCLLSGKADVALGERARLQAQSAKQASVAWRPGGDIANLINGYQADAFVISHIFQ
jgi:hypothetical protein